MASSAFNHLAPGITLSDTPPVPADLRTLHHPAGFYPAFSRGVLHETLHLWQYLSSGYLVGLVEEDWSRLKSFERDRTPLPAGPRKHEFLSDSALVPFNPEDLLEGLARFWELHILGPPLLIELELANPERAIPEDFSRRYWKEKAAGRITHPQTGAYSSLAYQMAMECAAHGYGKPYLWLREQTNDLLANILFPLCGYFAFQTPDPLRAFNVLVRYGSSEFPDLRPERPIHDWWREGYIRLGRLAVHAAQQFWGKQLEHIGTAVTEGGLADHPSWTLFFELRRGAAVRFRDLPLFDATIKLDPDKPELMHGQFNLEYALACPGDPDYRGTLVQTLAPSSIQFADKTCWNLGALAACYDQVPLQQRMHCVVEEQCQGLQSRWDHFLREKIGW